MVPWKKTLTIPSLRKNDHRTGLHHSITSLGDFSARLVDTALGSDQLDSLSVTNNQEKTPALLLIVLQWVLILVHLHMLLHVHHLLL